MTSSRKTLGLLGGGGTGPELIDAMLGAIGAVESVAGVRFDIVRFDDARWRRELETEVMDAGLLTAMSDFYAEVRDRGGCLLRGAVQAPVLYKVRELFQQYFKLNPIIGIPELAELTRFSRNSLDGLSLLLVRENTIGEFHGHTRGTRDGTMMVVEHCRRDIERLAEYVFGLVPGGSVALAMPTRKMGLCGALWEEVFVQKAAMLPGVRFRTMQPNLEKIAQWVRTRRHAGPGHGAYEQPLNWFDVIVGPEMFMDYLMDDVAWMIHGEPFLGCSGNFSPDGFSVYQTVHGTLIPLRGRDMVNPIAMIHALAMCLRMSFGLERAATALEQAVRHALATGLRTFDIHRGDPRYTLVGTGAMVTAVLEHFDAIMSLPAAAGAP